MPKTPTNACLQIHPHRVDAQSVIHVCRVTQNVAELCCYVLIITLRVHIHSTTSRRATHRWRWTIPELGDMRQDSPRNTSQPGIARMLNWTRQNNTRIRYALQRESKEGHQRKCKRDPWGERVIGKERKEPGCTGPAPSCSPCFVFEACRSGSNLSIPLEYEVLSHCLASSWSDCYFLSLNCPADPLGTQSLGEDPPYQTAALAMVWMTRMVALVPDHRRVLAYPRSEIMLLWARCTSVMVSAREIPVLAWRPL
ncbi:hypothetical protein JB92DRAFT_1513474 [Gautieria morchelliformis]|nr:hypothetical protein JB92DRAFT_1513474 [Gautieria morchelliformis]